MPAITTAGAQIFSLEGKREARVQARLQASRFERQRREAGQPVLAHIVARHVIERAGQMRMCGIVEHGHTHRVRLLRRDDDRSSATLSAGERNSSPPGSHALARERCGLPGVAVSSINLASAGRDVAFAKSCASVRANAVLK